MTRRNFIEGEIAAGAVASSSAYLFRAAALQGQPAAAGAVERLITLTVNGQDRRVDVVTQDTLARTLRYKLGLTGTKLMRPRGVRRLHRPDRRCAALLVLGADAHRARQEGRDHRRPRERGRRAHPVQRAVVDGQGFQCAFCMPGFVMATIGYLKTNPNPTRPTGARHLGEPVPLPGLRQESPTVMSGAEYARRA